MEFADAIKEGDGKEYIAAGNASYQFFNQVAEKIILLKFYRC